MNKIRAIHRERAETTKKMPAGKERSKRDKRAEKRMQAINKLTAEAKSKGCPSF